MSEPREEDAPVNEEGANNAYEMDPALKEKKSKNLLWLGIFSIVMMFSGLTSAYLVIKSDNFWVNIQQPTWFMISTVVIVISSLTFYMGLRSAKTDKNHAVKIWIGITVLLGAGFTYSQFKGWKELTDNGYFFVGPITAPGAYGESVIVTKDGKPVDHDGYKYSIQGQELSENALKEFKAYCNAIHEGDHKKLVYKLDDFPGYSISVFNDKALQYEAFEYRNGQFFRSSPMGDEHALSILQGIELKHFADNMHHGRGLFFMTGDYGKDYWIYYQGVKLKYEGGNLYAGDHKLNEDDLMRLDNTRNVASSFVYLLSFLHLLHLIGGWIYLLVVFNGALRTKYGSSNHLKIKLGSIYWHFLGGLWIYLYLFLSYIH